MKIAALLLEWYDKNARDLPWRRDKDPYKIWVSEIMLQQTRVEAVKEYYERWIARFPNPGELARASEQEVLTYWQGLGYYSRARNLLAGVREVCADYGGSMPEEGEQVRSLPGIGDYTAGAILSIAYNRRVPAVDGNVMRIFSRLFCLEEDILKAPAKRTVSRLVQEQIDRDRPGDFNQALMDLGALICIPQRPRCQECPVRELCLACERGVQEVLPVRSPKKAPVKVSLAAALLEQDGRYLICQRPASGLLAGMWEFPSVELDGTLAEADQLQDWLQAKFSIQVEVLAVERQLVHTFSHRQWYMVFYRCRLLDGAAELPEHARWFSLTGPERLPWAGPHCNMAVSLGGIKA